MTAKNLPKARRPVHVKVTKGDKFQVVGDDTDPFDSIIDANKRARKVGPGTEVIRLSDGKLVSVVANKIPSGRR